jgi:hypothetical protein
MHPTLAHRGVLITAPHGNDAWVERVRGFVQLDSADFEVEHCFTRGRPVAERVALRRLYARGARKIVVLRLAPQADGWPHVTQCFRLCGDCLDQIVKR